MKQGLPIRILAVLSLLLCHCRSKIAELPSPLTSKMSTVTIPEFIPSSTDSTDDWVRMELRAEMLAPRKPAESIRFFERGTGSELRDQQLRLDYGIYHLVAHYFDVHGQKIYETCEASRLKQHTIDKAEYVLTLEICDARKDPYAASAEPSGKTSFVAQHGFPVARNGKLLDKYLRPIQLRGMSLFWSHWSAPFWNRGVITTLKEHWGATLIRAAMGVEEGGFLSNPEAEKSRVKLVVEEAVKHGIYVIIDWHDHNAINHVDQARDFFAEMAALYGQVPNVIFEIYNEPISQSWDQVKQYAEAVIGAIRSKQAKNLVIIGSPSWSQRVDLAADNPIQDSNIAYTLHFYSMSHRQDLREKARYAISKGLTLFVTEFGVCDATGDGQIDLQESDQWLSFLEENKISWANWSLNDKPESASALKPGANVLGSWQDSDLTVSGLYVKSKIQQGHLPNPNSKWELARRNDSQHWQAKGKL